MEYIKLRRMARATVDLLDKKQRILDIALNLGFPTHEHFTRTFKSTFAITPDEYRKNPIVLNCMTKPELMLDYVLLDEGVPLVTNGMVLEINRKLVQHPILYGGFQKNLRIEYGEGLGSESGEDVLYALWDNLHSEKVNHKGLEHDAEEIGVVLPCKEEGYYSYFVGTRLNDKATSSYTTWTLPEGEYIICSFEAEDFKSLVMDALYKVQQYLFNVWLPKHKLSTDMFCLEYYENHTPDTTNMEVWVKLVKGERTCI